MYPFLQHHIFCARCAADDIGVWGKVLGRGDKYGGAMFGVRGVGKSNHDQGNVQVGNPEWKRAIRKHLMVDHN